MRFPALILAFLLFPALAHADPAVDALTEVAKCADVADPAERLKCFDRAAPLARSALAPATKAAAEKKGFLDWFGFSKPSAPQTVDQYGKPQPEPTPEEVKGITSGVLEFARTPRGEAIFILDNGQVWRQLTSDTSTVRDPPPGQPMKVTIENGFLGSYNLTVDWQKGLIKVTRLK
ncbi:MAG TPA: hypothetical protein PLW68_04390 [Casimicrobiaceae bacterium]|nr:hypothetical protein [Casimicrobiaceae bacterium]